MSETDGRNRGAVPYHPLLAAILPVLLLLSANAGVAPPMSGMRTAGVLLLLTVVLWALAALILRSVSRAAAPTTALVLLGAMLMPVHRAVIGISWIDAFSHRLIAGGVVAAGLLLLAALLVRQMMTRAEPPAVNRGLNLLLVCLIVVPLANITWVSLFTRGHSDLVTPPQIDTSRFEHRPDVYYIIPDGYGRNDVLERRYQYDNSDFTAALEELGFVVADASNSNYHHTVMSLPSSLNMSYLSAPHESIASRSYLVTTHLEVSGAL